MIKVAIFEDNSTLRDSLRFLIMHSPGYECVGAFPDCNLILENLRESNPDVVLMDIQMPGMDGIDAVKILKKEFPNIQVIMQTVFDDDERIFKALCAGASGYFLKNAPPANLLNGIDEVYHGGSPMSPSIARKVLNMLSNNSQPKNTDNEFQLSEREKELLALLVKGFSYRQIAATLFISYETVRTHMKNIYQKLHVRSQHEAVALVLNKRLV